MKKFIFYFVLASILISVSTACKTDEPDTTEKEIVLPTGENSMYYYIDNALYIPRGNTIGGIHIDAINHTICAADPTHTTFTLGTSNIYLHFYNGIQETGVITLNQSHHDLCQTTDYNAFYSTSELWDDGIYHTTSYYTRDGTGEINITYLSDDKQQFKGTFNMTVYHMNTGVTKEITEGHFNINLDTL